MSINNKVAKDTTLADIAAAIREFSTSSLSYTALLALQEEMDGFETEVMAMVGAPLEAELASDMTDTTKIYVYVGSESGYTNGNWYYYKNSTSTWTSGGIYNAVAVDSATLEEIQEYIP